MTAHLLTVLVSCFAMMETPNGVPSHPGPAGETGRWQLTPAVRHDRTRDLKWLLEPHRITDEAIAMRQVLWIREQLIANGFKKPSYFEIALAWNAGVHAAVTHGISHSTLDYARRFTALVDEAVAAK